MNTNTDNKKTYNILFNQKQSSSLMKSLKKAERRLVRKAVKKIAVRRLRSLLK